jgi:predicted sulfurtransferase
MESRAKPKIKKCKGCGQVKAEFEFYSAPSYKNNLHTHCKPCVRAKQKMREVQAELAEENKIWGKGFRPNIRLKDWDQLE